MIANKTTLHFAGAEHRVVDSRVTFSTPDSTTSPIYRFPSYPTLMSPHCPSNASCCYQEIDSLLVGPAPSILSPHSAYFALTAHHRYRRLQQREARIHALAGPQIQSTCTAVAVLRGASAACISVVHRIHGLGQKPVSRGTTKLALVDHPSANSAKENI